MASREVQELSHAHVAGHSHALAPLDATRAATCASPRGWASTWPSPQNCCATSRRCADDARIFFTRRGPRAPPRIHRSTRRLSRWGTAETRHRSKHTEGHKPSTPSSEESPRALRQRVPALRARSPRVRAHGEGPRARVCPPHGSGHRVQSCVSGPFGALEQNGAHSGRVPTPGRRCAARPATTTGAAARRGLRWRRRRARADACRRAGPSACFNAFHIFS